MAFQGFESAFLAQLAADRGSDLRDLDVALLVAPGSQPPPLLSWYLHRAQVRKVGGIGSLARDEVMVSMAGQEPPAMGEEVSGRSFRLSQSWQPQGLSGGALWHWLLFDHFDILQGQERAVVWVGNTGF